LKKGALKYIYFLVAAPILLNGCVGIKHLKENEKLLYRQAIVGPKNIDTDDLQNLYVQQPNRKFLGLPIAPLVGIYYLGQNHYDTAKLKKKLVRTESKYAKKIASTTKTRRINNLQFRRQKKIDRINDHLQNGNTIMQWGEPISIFDSTQVFVTETKFSDYLFSQGYFTNLVSHKTINIGKFVNLTYRVDPGRAYILDSIVYQVKDSSIYELISKTKNQSFLKKNDRYIADNFAKERERIDLLLKDNGYYDFSRLYIEFAVDTTLLGNRQISVLVLIRDPAQSESHKQFTIDSVNVNINTSFATGLRQNKKYRGINFSYQQKDYNLKILSQRVFLLPGNFYSRTKTLNTQRQMANLDAFKFINVNYDTSGGKFIANVFTSPLDRYEWSNEVGVNVTQGFPGPFYSINFKKRNIFKGFENFDLNGRIGFEGVAAATNELDIYTSTEAGANASLTFPQFIWPFREKTQIKIGKYNPKTRISVGYAYTDRPEYRRSSTNAAATYTWQNKQSNFYSLSLVNLSVINSTIVQQSFQDLLNEQDSLGNRSLSNSFNPSFVSSIIFNFTWNPDNYGNTDKSSVFIRTAFESGGLLFNFIDPTFITNQGLAYFKYLRLSLDIRRISVINKSTVIAKRFNAGIAYSYSNDLSLPYEKFFFAGGSNSIRAWRPRRLGPGSLKPPLSNNPRVDGLYSYQIEQPAEMLLEGSLELRKKLFGFVSGALFVDAGNVWTRQERRTDDTEIEEAGSSKFDIKQFYKDIAVGTGFGFRFDFSFLILRFDVGIKVLDPARSSTDRFVLDNMKFFRPFDKNREPVIYNIGIGYPF
jgi:outer membrane protein insertion porin family